MKRLFILFLSFLFCVSFFSCGSKSNVEEVSPEETMKLIKKGIVVIDVRTPEEFASGHIKNAKNIDFMSRDFFKRIESLDKNSPYIICSRDGRTGMVVAKVMESEGFKKLYNMDGGIIGWAEKSYPVVKE
ncbi:rhodanese-like domain-containing protein [Desulfurobacterium sp.]